jgi:predicted RND superfamily exporter protein
MESMARLIVQRPKLVLLLVAIVTLVLGYYARQIRIDSSIDGLLRKGDPEKQYYDQIRRTFGSDDVVVVAIVADSVYTPRTVQKIDRLTRELGKIPEVRSVLSMTNAKDIVADVLGDGETPALMVASIPETAQAAAALQAKFAQEPLYLDLLVSADGRAAAINIAFRSDVTDQEFLKRKLDERIRVVIAREDGGPERIYYTGLPHLKAAVAVTQREDLTRLLPATLVLLLIALFFCLRSIRGVVLPTLTVLITLIWTLGIMVLAGSNLSLGTIALPPMLLVLGIAYSLHVMSEYYELARPGRRVDEVVLETLRTINMPVLIAALTTVVGFLSLFVNEIVSIREMGIYSAIGIISAFVLSVGLVPAALALLPLPARAQDAYSPGLSAALRRLTRWIIRHRRPVLATSALLAVLFLLPIPSIQVGSNFLSLFRAGHPTTVATNAVNEFMGGTLAFYVVIDSKTPDIMKKAETLKRVKGLQRFIASQPGVDKTLSLVDYHEAIDRGLQAVPPEEGVPAPPARGELFDDQSRVDDVLQLMFLSPGAVAGFVDQSYARSNILVRTSLSRPSEISALVERITAFAPRVLLPELTAHPTGNLILNTRTTHDLVIGQIESLAITAGVIFVIMSAMFLSFRVGLVAMIPNLFPIVFFFALMGFSGAVLSVTTNTIAAIVLGLAVDDTVHIMSRLSSEIRVTVDQQEAVLRSVSTVGKPTLYYSLLVLLGFSTFGLSTFVPIQQFGLLSAATVFVGVVAEIVLLPALLATIPVVTLWNVLYVRLGKEPHKTIPLFAGLRPFQAKIVTLMGELKSFARGQHIIRQGERGNEMYVVIKGAADVVMHGDSHSVRLGTVRRGDVVGEMGFVSHHERLADVIANEDVEVLAVNESFLNRVKRRYPRIATEIFFNISRILSERLEAAQRAR